MNEREFLKRIKSKKYNENGENTQWIVSDLLTQTELVKPNFIQKIFSRFFQNSRGTKIPEQIVVDNFKTIFDTLRNRNQLDMYDINKINNLMGFLKSCHNISIELDNVDEIVDRIQDEDLWEFCECYLKGANQETINKLNGRLKENKIEIAKKMLNNDRLRKVNDNGKEEKRKEEKRKGYSETLAIIIDELLESEHCRYTDIRQLKSGGFSQIYQIGSKILKVGKPRGAYNMPNHNRFIQPLTRTNFIDEENNNEPLVCIEIEDEVDLVDLDEFSDEDLYNIYKELRESGIIWTDAKIQNIGRLRGDNTPTLNEEKMDVAPNSVGFTNGKNERELSQGDFVIIDLDFVFNENDPNIIKPVDGGSKSMAFEQRYQQERAEETVKAFIERNKNREGTSCNENERDEERN